MDRRKRPQPELFQDGVFVGFGPSRFWPTPWKPIFHAAENHGQAELRDHVREEAPRQPGCYGMLDGLGRVIYIGKAKDLRARLLSYFREKSRDPKAGRILDHTKTLLWEQTADEFSALLRELELIRRFRPRYNVQGQPGPRRYRYVCLGRMPAPYAYVTREPTGRELACYGPFKGRGYTREAVRRLNDWYQLRDCSSKIPMIFADQSELFPNERAAQCLRFDLNACLGPCAGYCTQASYQAQVRRVKAFLDGQDLSVLDELTRLMTEAAVQHQYERAISLRDRLIALSWLNDRLQFLRNARLGGAFIYPIRGRQSRAIWYLIHRGEVQAALHEPRTAQQKRDALQRMNEAFAPRSEDAVRSHRSCDSVLLVAAWFRKMAAEREKLVPYSLVQEQLLEAVAKIS